MSVTAPKALEFLEVTVLTHSGDSYDITENISSFDLYEDIDSFFIHGEMGIIDNSGIIWDFPMIGQEAITIRFKKPGDFNQTIERTFYVTGINHISRFNESTATFMVALVSYYQVTNAQSIFSRSYKGLNTEIIQKIYKDHFDYDLDYVAEGGTSHNVVFPYLKPFQAIKQILDTTYAADGTPLFLFETLYDNQVVLKSWGEMMGADINTDIGFQGDLTPNAVANKDDNTGQSSREEYRWQERFDAVKIKKAYDMFKDITLGSLKHQVDTVDISNKTYKQSVFDYREQAKPLTNDYVRDDVNQELKKEARIRLQRTNGLAFSSLSNLATTSALGKSASNSYKNRRDTIILEASGPGIEKLKCGECVNIDNPLFRPTFSKGDEDLDTYNSGKFLISAICHTYNKKRYTVSVELIRDGYNPKVEIK